MYVQAGTENILTPHGLVLEYRQFMLKSFYQLSTTLAL